MAVIQSSPASIFFVADGSEMAERIRAHDWASTSLGPIEAWPQNLRTVVDLMLTSPGPTSVMWGPERVQLYNDAYVPIAGERHPEALGRRTAENWSDAYDSFLGPVLDRVFAGEAVRVDEHPVPLCASCGGLKERVFTGSFQPVRDEVGQVVGVFHPLVEEAAEQTWAILERARTEEALRGSEARLAAIFAGATVGLSEVDLGGRFLRVNEELCRIVGRGRDELLGLRIVDVTHPDSVRPSMDAIAEALKTGQAASLDKRYVRPDGSSVWASSRVSHLNDDGQSGNLLVVTVDLTERLAAEERVRESEGRYRQIVEGAEDFAIATIDEHGRITSWNTGAARITGFEEGDIVGRSGEIIFTPEDRVAGAPDHELDRAKADGRSLNERWHIRKDGTRFWGSGVTMRLDQPGGGYLKIFRDRTPEHEAEAALRQAQAALAAEVEALGQLQEVSTRLIGDEAPQSVYDAILTAATDLMGSECASIQMLNASGDLELLAHRGYDPRSAVYWQTVRATSESTCGVALTTGERVVVPDVEDSGLTVGSGDLQSYRWTGMRAVQTTPLLSRSGKPIGMISTHWKRPLRPPERDLKLFDVLARQAADAIERTTAQAELRESEARQAFLLSLADTLRSLRTSAEIASTAAELLGERFGLSRVFYAEYFGSLMRVERDYTNGVASIAGEHDLTAFGPELLRAYRECPIVKVDDVRTDPRFSEEARAGLQARQVGAYFDVVLFEEDQWVSLLALQSAAPRAWTASEEGLFQEVGERVKVAIERARAEDRLRELNETLEAQVAARTAALRRYHDIVDATVAPICAFDTDYRVIAFNRAHNAEFRRVNGFDTKVGDIFPDLFIPEQGAKMRALMTRALAGERFTVLEEFGRPELGTPCWEITYTPLLEEDGRVVGTFYHAVDISDRLTTQAELEAAQEALRQSQKMEAMGQLTGGVAHDFNNLLTPIVGALDMLQRKGFGGEREQRLITGAAQSAERAKTLVQRLLAFARRQPLQAVPVDIVKLVHGMGDLVSSTTGPQIRVLVEAPDDLPPAKADPNQLEMALLNLSVNARDAMPDNGTLRISASAEAVGPGHRSKLRTGAYICLSVADTGSGMDEATLARAVEPFFSTKGVGKGTGLGLSMVHGLASQLGGALTIQSRPGLGTNVELWLPVSAARPELPEAVPDNAPPPAARGTALLVDDEELVRTSTADMLSDLGYSIIEAASAEEAIRFADQGGPFDLLVTDHLMPGMNGTDLARAIRTARPGVAVLLVSGYAEREGIAPDLPRLTKPFRKDELAASLAQLPSSN
ncbi:PAS domain S-box protein [Methylobacterium tardum]|uniref:PAS domain S-box protein n=1 Tax=Methylobacterium tardum TaxID=374432 RepID=UPI00361EA949